MNLTLWQKKQAALLYHFSSLKYLEGLKDQVIQLRMFAEGILDISHDEGRDLLLRCKQWGSRNTSENWENNAWPFLGDFQRSVAQSIADLKSNIYHKTGAYQCGRGMAEFSMQWTTPEEQEQFDRMFEAVSKYARYIDNTMDRAVSSTRWNDFGLTLAWEGHRDIFPVLPKFRVIPELVCESGQVPPKTGVYVSINDPNASLQFAWTGNATGKLLAGTTFNDLGRAALASVGRTKLWTDGSAMLRFVVDNLSSPDLRQDSFFEESQTPELAPSLVARNAFRPNSSRWCFVGLVNDEVEEIYAEPQVGSAELLRFDAGEYCVQAGFYLSPAAVNSRRYYRPGEQFDNLNSDYGKTIWQWDSDQGQKT